MTIEAEDRHSLWMRSARPNGDVLLLQIDANTGNLLIDAYHPHAADAECMLVIPPTEALALGHMLIDMARRLLDAPKPEPKKVPATVKTTHCTEYDKANRQFQARLSKLVEDLEISTRSANCLRHHGIVYLGDLAKMQEREARGIHNLGKRSFAEIEQVLFKHGLTFGSDVSSWRRPIKKGAMPFSRTHSVSPDDDPSAKVC